LADVEDDPNVLTVEPNRVQGIFSQTVPTGVQRIGAEPLAGTGSTATNTTAQSTATTHRTNITSSTINSKAC